jgi:hypothetical protein
VDTGEEGVLGGGGGVRSVDSSFVYFFAKRFVVRYDHGSGFGLLYLFLGQGPPHLRDVSWRMSSHWNSNWQARLLVWFRRMKFPVKRLRFQSLELRVVVQRKQRDTSSGFLQGRVGVTILLTKRIVTYAPEEPAT